MRWTKPESCPDVTIRDKDTIPIQELQVNEKLKKCLNEKILKEEFQYLTPHLVATLTEDYDFLEQKTILEGENSVPWLKKETRYLILEANSVRCLMNIKDGHALLKLSLPLQRPNTLNGMTD